MEAEELHYPPGAEPEKPADEPKPEETPDKDKAPEPEAEKPEDKKPAEEKPETKKPEEGKEPPPEQPVKKRSIYDDLKEKKHQAKEWQDVATAALKATGLELQGNESAAELQALLAKKHEAKTPEEKKEAKDDLDAFAEQEGLKPEALKGLIDIIQKRLPPQESSVLTKEEAEEWRAERARAKQASEDQAILSEAPKVKEQLAISDEAELDNVMKEVVRLAHTPEFHDKEVDYIIWKNKATLAKMVSPKKASFEAGGQRGDAPPEGDIELSGKTTPQQAEQALSRSPKPSYEFRRST
jgi:hypothetical protein